MSFESGQIFQLGIHELAICNSDVIGNPSIFPASIEGCVVEVVNLLRPDSSLIAEINVSTQLKSSRMMISLSRPRAEQFGFQQFQNVAVRLVDNKAKFEVLFTTLILKNQFIARGELWRIRDEINGLTIYDGKEIGVLNTRLVAADTQPRCGIIGTGTRVVFRSKSCRVIWMVQLSSEMWDLNSDSSTENETLFDRMLKGFVRPICDKWKEQGTNHSLSIIYFSRSTDGKDYYKMVLENDSKVDSVEIVKILKREWIQFPRDCGWNLSEGSKPTDSAHGNLLEAINTAINVLEKHYMDRDLHRTGNSLVLLSPGGDHGMFHVDANLSIITNQRMTDNGIGVDLLVLKSYEQLFVTPLFSCQIPSGINEEKRTFYEIPSYLGYSIIDSHPFCSNYKSTSVLPFVLNPSSTFEAIWPTDYNINDACDGPSTTCQSQSSTRPPLISSTSSGSIAAVSPSSFGNTPFHISPSVLKPSLHRGLTNDVYSMESCTAIPSTASSSSKSPSSFFSQPQASTENAVQILSNIPFFLESKRSITRRKELEKICGTFVDSDCERVKISWISSIKLQPFAVEWLACAGKLRNCSLDSTNPILHLDDELEESELFVDDTSNCQRSCPVMESFRFPIVPIFDEPAYGHADFEVSCDSRYVSVDVGMDISQDSTVKPSKKIHDFAITGSLDEDEDRPSIPLSTAPTIGRKLGNRTRLDSALSCSSDDIASLEDLELMKDFMTRYDEDVFSAMRRDVRQKLKPPSPVKTVKLSSVDSFSFGPGHSQKISMSSSLIQNSKKLGPSHGSRTAMLTKNSPDDKRQSISPDAPISIKRINKAVAVDAKRTSRLRSGSEAAELLVESKPSSFFQASTLSNEPCSFVETYLVLNQPVKIEVSRNSSVCHQLKNDFFSMFGDISDMPNAENFLELIQRSINPCCLQSVDKTFLCKTHVSRRWAYAFASDEVYLRSMTTLNDESLVQPAILPFITDFIVSPDELLLKYAYANHSVLLPTLDNSQSTAHLRSWVIMEMIYHRLAQDYQLVTGINMESYRHCLKSITPSQAIVAILTLGHRIQIICHNVEDQCVNVHRFLQRDNVCRSMDYTYNLWIPEFRKFGVCLQTFTQYTQPEYPWDKFDLLLVDNASSFGMSTQSQALLYQSLKTDNVLYRRVRFELIPDDNLNDLVERFQKLLEFIMSKATPDSRFPITIRNGTASMPVTSRNGRSFDAYTIFDKQFDIEHGTTEMDFAKIISLDPRGKGREQRFYVGCDTVFDPHHIYHIELFWLTCDSWFLDEFVRSVYIKGNRLNLRIVQIPEYGRGSNLSVHPFVSQPLIISMSSCGVWAKIAEADLVALYDFVTDSGLPSKNFHKDDSNLVIKIRQETHSILSEIKGSSLVAALKTGSKQTSQRHTGSAVQRLVSFQAKEKQHDRQYMHKSGYALVRVNADGFYWMSNRLKINDLNISADDRQNMADLLLTSFLSHCTVLECCNKIASDIVHDVLSFKLS